MRDELVALDLETTGLDPMSDDIIEVGAVRMKDGQVIAEYSTMVEPDRPIPSHVTHITGIQQEDVQGAPKIAAILPEIENFVKDAPIVAHNITLDMGLLQDRHKILLNSARIDTYDLASILIPNAPRYNLNSLTTQVGIELDHAHRALDDARASGLLYYALWEKLLAVPDNIIEELITAAKTLNWGGRLVLEAALRERKSDTVTPTSQFVTGFKPYDVSQQVPLGRKQSRQLLSVEAVTAYFEGGGQLSGHIEHFEQRPQQIEMVRQVTQAFNESQHLLLEAGTGAGKSIAYLIPSILWAVQNDEQVVISTNTLNLQDQLLLKDIPLLRETLGMDFKVAVLKGRSNYLCPRRLEAIRRRLPTSEAELLTYGKIRVWLLENDSGDRNEISLRGPVENNIWNRLSAGDERCSLHRCETTMQGACPFYRARKEAEQAHVVIVNHALLVSDANTENSVLPQYRHLVIDEAHHLEDAVTRGLSFHLDSTVILRRLADLGGLSAGLLGEVLERAREHASEKAIIKMEKFIQIIEESTGAMQVHVRNLFIALYKFMADVKDIRSTDFVTTLSVERGIRNKASFTKAQNVWKALEEFFQVISMALQRLTKALGKLQPYSNPAVADLMSSTDTAARFMQEIHTELHSFLLEPDDGRIYWLTAGQAGEVAVLHTAPLHVGAMAERYLWHDKDTVVMTSATLRTQDSFMYIKDRLYADNFKTVEVGSPFNYRETAMVYIPNDIPEPQDRNGYQRAVEQAIVELSAALKGRVMVLFTSFSQLRQTSQSVSSKLEALGIEVFDQSDGTSRQALLEGFKTTEKAVLLGTKSFWEGVDIPGESLSAVIITRLPFAVPSDPIFSARSDTYNNGFEEYALPDAILRFRQGFGRLIRSSTDRGVMVVLDRRIITKAYGVSFLEGLPDCTMRDGTLADLPKIAANWLNREA